MSDTSDTDCCDVKSMACSMRSHRRIPLYGEKSRGCMPYLAIGTIFDRGEKNKFNPRYVMHVKHRLDGNFRAKCKKVDMTIDEWHENPSDGHTMYIRSFNDKDQSSVQKRYLNHKKNKIEKDWTDFKLI